MTVEELIAKLEALPSYHEVKLDPRNGSPAHELTVVAQLGDHNGPSVVLR